MDKVEIIRYINTLLRKKVLDEKEIVDVLSNSEVIKAIVENTSTKSFRKIMGLLNNPQDIINKRNEYELKALENIYLLEVKHKKDLICQRYFGDFAVNVLYTVETILERIESNVTFSELFSDDSMMFLKELHIFLSSNNEKIKVVDFKNRLDMYQNTLLAENSDLEDMLEKLFILAQRDFKNEVVSAVNEKDVLDGIDPQILSSSKGNNAEFYVLQTQTDAQKGFYFLTRTANICDYMKKEKAMDEYENAVGKYIYSSYSLVNDEIYGGFSSKYRIKFGYMNIGNIELMSSNAHDGQTNQYTLVDGFYVIKQQYLGLNDYMNRTDSYNEIVVKNDPLLKPSFILVDDMVVNDDIIAIADNMRIPIVYIDPKYYKEHKATNPISEEEMKCWYCHNDFLDYSLGDCLGITNIK